MADAASKGDAAETSYPFITVNPDTNKFEIHDDAVRVLNAMQCPVAVVSVAGLYRTGKSYLLNLLKAPPGRDPNPTATGFGVGNTTNAHTKGIWLWGQPVRIEDQDVAVVFLDTGGPGEHGGEPDARLQDFAPPAHRILFRLQPRAIDGNAIGFPRRQPDQAHSREQRPVRRRRQRV